ncbi:alpha/beta hydrolase (plasmid) [Rhodococcus oxybenzonivorans]|uniref:Alpha/beta hydrolase n=1 Tax=Rhodococcus oxybenzonivorans TaxID=1990687 RepID=A0A2S2C5V5_9NOCA|nr:alpha/beta hydrolase [Rhodococcus oxybenzonivorans]AWK76281.1 alpha/beta hydrolase [Rhodococcus oxybenzonivorans]
MTPAVDATRMRIPSGDVTLVADAFGDPGDIPVVLLHGGGQTRHSWRDTAAALAKAGWYAVAVDQRGHGESGWSSDRRYDLQRFAADVVSVADHIGRPPVLVGASLGGNAALSALGRYPELALGLVMVDVSPFLQPKGRERILGFMTGYPAGFASLDEVADAVAAYLPHRPRPRNLEGLRKNLRERDGRLFWHWDPELMRRQTDDAVQRDVLLDPARLGAAANSLRIPTLLVRGAESDVLSQQDARRFLELVPHVDFREVAGAHHMVAGDDNTAFGSVLDEFLQQRIRRRYELLAEQKPDN